MCVYVYVEGCGGDGAAVPFWIRRILQLYSILYTLYLLSCAIQSGCIQNRWRAVLDTAIYIHMHTCACICILGNEGAGKSPRGYRGLLCSTTIEQDFARL